MEFDRNFFLEYHASVRLESAALTIREQVGANAFYSLIMAAMREAGSDEMEKLSQAFPEAAQQLRSRYNAGGGRLAGETAENGFRVPGVEAQNYCLKLEKDEHPDQDEDVVFAIIEE